MKLAGIDLRGGRKITAVDLMRTRHFTGTPPGFSSCEDSDNFEHKDGATEYIVEMRYHLLGGPIGTIADRVYGRSLMNRIIEQRRIIFET